MSKPRLENLCMAPWTHTYLSPQGERRLCCASREPSQNFRQYIDTSEGTGKFDPMSLEQWWNSEHIRRIRRQMMNNEVPAECTVCDKKLLNTDVYRDYFWHLFKHYYNDVWDTTDKTGFTTMKPISWDYRFSNLCNFKCRMCGSMLSSSWEAEEKKFQNNDFTLPHNQWMLESIRTQMKRWLEDVVEKEFGAAIESGTVEEIYWVGGEPLMYEQHWEYMQRLIDLDNARKVYVRYNTNLSRIDYKGQNLYNFLPKFRDWQICASLDGTGKIGEYIRTGLDYNKWLYNFQEGVKIQTHPRQMRIDFTLTTPGLLEIKNIAKLAKELNVGVLAKLTFGFTPNIIICPLALPRLILEEILNENIKWLENFDYDTRPLEDLLKQTLTRKTFEEEWPDSYKQGLIDGKDRYKTLDRIRKTIQIEEILSQDKRLINWWNNIDEKN